MATCPPLGFSGEYYRSSGDGSCVRQSSFFEGKAVLNQGVGYSVILGFGAFFAIFTSFLVWLEKRYVGSRHTSEWFNTAGRNVLLFGVMAIEIKRKAPNAHTVCEIVKARWGTAAHLVFLCFCFLTNIIVTAMLLLGGSAVVNALTGVMPHYAMSFSLSFTAVLQSKQKGFCKSNAVSAKRDEQQLKCIVVLAEASMEGFINASAIVKVETASTKGMKYLQSMMYDNSITYLHVVLVIFVYLVYTASSKLGSPSVVYRHLLEVSSKSRICQEPLSHNGQSCGPVSGNYKGSYLTMLSSGGLVFGIINIVGNFGTVFVDNVRLSIDNLLILCVIAIAARPSSTHKGYLLGGLVWFAVPFSLATSLGLGALALDLPLTASEASRGLVPAATAIALMGKGGSILLLTMLFMAVTSAGSSELIAVSSLCTYDIYRTYINPEATGKQILKVSRAVVLAFGCFMGLLAVILNKASVSLGWMYLAMGVLIGSAVIPISFLLLWRKANALGAILGPIIGCSCGVITWLSVASIEYGRVNLDTTGRNAPMLAGNLVSIITGGVVHFVCSVLRPQNYEWDTTKQITMVEKEKSELPVEELKEEKLLKAKVWILKWGVGFTFVIAILWPLLSLPAGQFSKGYFTFWAVIAIAWGTVGSAIIIALPLMESWKTIESVLLGLFTNDRLVEKVDELNSKLHALVLAVPEAERIYLLEKEKAKKKETLTHKETHSATV
ncbi:hypothetical protein LguiB_028404 [Lonicera macranthoides]